MTPTHHHQAGSRAAARCALAGISLAAGLSLHAQTPGTPTVDESVALAPFTVTGSHIPTTETAFDARTVPVQIITRQLIAETGYATAGELLQRMTISNGGSVPISNAATTFTPAASSTSLRGLGPQSTLVLINGRRVAPYPIGTGGTTAFVDLNSIPLAAIERVEVLKDGASATYGADAVAGVVNIILRRDFDGSEAFVSYGNTTDADAHELTANFITGATSARTSVTVGANYYKKADLFARDRSYSAIPPFLSSNSSPINLAVSREAALEALGLPAGASIPGVEDDATSMFASTYDQREANNGALPASAYTYSGGRTSVYNFNESAGAYPSSERMGAFLNAERKLHGTEHVTLYAEAIYQHVQARNELAPSATGNFANPGGVSIVIPARTASPLGDRLAPAGAYNPFNPFNEDISGATRFRLAEFGNRIYRDETNSFLATVGVRADEILGKWQADAGVRYSRIESTTDNTLVSISRFLRTLNAADPIFNPASAEYIGTTTPYNPFGYYQNPIANNALVADYALVRQHDINESDLASAFFTASTAELFTLPAGAAGFAFGGDYRRESLTQSPDATALAGDLIGSSPAAITNADRQIGSVFAELELPLVAPSQDVPLAHALSLNVAGRFEKFVTSHRDTFVPKLGLKWLPVDDSLVVRATWGEGFREPSLYELFAGSTALLTPTNDPVTGTVEPETDATTASNRNLAAEESESLNVGVVYTPAALPGFTVSLDFWRLERDGAVVVDHQDVLLRGISGQLLPGESVIRDSEGNIIQINGVFRNQGREKIQGIDLATSYVLTTESAGRFDFGVNATYTDSYKIQTSPSAPFFDYIGKSTDVLFDAVTGKVVSPGTGDDGYLQWKGQAFVGWTLGSWNAHVTAHYTDGFDDYTADFWYEDPDNPDGLRTIEDQITWDVQVNYTLRPGAANWLGDTKITVGVQNVFDEDPPFASAGGNNANGYPGYLYNSTGRFVYVALSKKL